MGNFFFGQLENLLLRMKNHGGKKKETDLLRIKNCGESIHKERPVSFDGPLVLFVTAYSVSPYHARRDVL